MSRFDQDKDTVILKCIKTLVIVDCCTNKPLSSPSLTEGKEYHAKPTGTGTVYDNEFSLYSDRGTAHLFDGLNRGADEYGFDVREYLEVVGTDTGEQSGMEDQAGVDDDDEQGWQ